MEQTHTASTDGSSMGGLIFDAFNWCCERTLAPEHRRYLARKLDGPVLDLGAGTGAMFPYFGAAAQREGSIAVTAVEPDGGFRERAKRKAERVGLDVDIRSGEAEALPFEDERFNTVIASVVFCTIPDVDGALDEVDRVLKPGGELRFFEHVRSHGRHGRIQDRVTPVWKRLAAGCHLNRDAERAISNSALEITEIEDVELESAVLPSSLLPIQRFVRGTAVKDGN